MEINQLARQGWLLLMTSVSRLLYPVTSLSKAPLLTSANEIAHLILWFKPGQVTEIKKNQPTEMQCLGCEWIITLGFPLVVYLFSN